VTVSRARLDETGVRDSDGDAIELGSGEIATFRLLPATLAG
jgi:hypothetical protein